jgi:hypothetical protein
MKQLPSEYLDTIHARILTIRSVGSANQGHVSTVADVYFYSSLSEDEVKKTHKPNSSIEAVLQNCSSITVQTPQFRPAEGPQTFPYLLRSEKTKNRV